MQHHGKPITKQKQTFSLLSDIDVEKTYFVTVKLNLLIIVLVFLSFINTFLEPAVSRCSSKQVLLKFLQHSELKRDSDAGILLFVL